MNHVSRQPAFNGGIAWIDVLCNDVSSAAGWRFVRERDLRHAYASGYAFNGSLGSVTTTVPGR